MAPLLELKDVHTYYGAVHALRGVSLKVEEGEIVTLIGSNGAGKTTTLRTISGLERARSGSITLKGKSIEATYLDFTKTFSSCRWEANCT